MKANWQPLSIFHLITVIVVVLVSLLTVEATTLKSATVAQSSTDITIQITAVVRGIDDPGNLLGGAITGGSILSGQYTFNSTTVDSYPLDAARGLYIFNSAPYGISLSSGGLTFESDPANVNFMIGVWNNFDFYDTYLVRSLNNRPLANGTLVNTIDWQLDDPTRTVLSSDALLTTPPDLSKWKSLVGLNINVYVTEPQYNSIWIFADVTSAVLVSGTPASTPTSISTNTSTSTSVPATNTPQPATFTATRTPVLPTNTTIPATLTPTSTATRTSVPPTNTATNTPIPATLSPTRTLVPATNTPQPTTPTATRTSVPPTNTATNPAIPATLTPTRTPVPATNTPRPATPTATRTSAPPTSTQLSPFATPLPGKASITLIKDAQPDSIQDFTLYGPFGSFKLDDAFPEDNDGINKSITYNNLIPGSHQFTEASFPSWYLVGVNCTTLKGSTTSLSNRTLTVNAVAGDIITCTYVNQRRVNIQAYSFNDLNADQSREATEPYQQYWEILFYSESNTLLYHAVTDANGLVSLTNRPPGIVKVCETLKAGWYNSVPTQLDPVLKLSCYTVALAPGQSANLLFGNTQSQAKNGGTAEDDAAKIDIIQLEDINEEPLPEETETHTQLFLPLVTR